MKEHLIEETVISPILDEDIKNHLDNSPIWNCAYTPEEVDDIVRRAFPKLFKYTIKFKGLEPVQHVKTEIL